MDAIPVCFAYKRWHLFIYNVLRRLELLIRIEVFQLIGHGRQESSAQSAVDDTVVIAHREVHHVADGDAVAVRRFYHHGAFFDGAYGQDGHLRLVDNGGTHEA